MGRKVVVEEEDPAAEKTVTIAIPSGVGGESPQIEAAPVNRRRTMANFAVTQSEKKYPDWKLYLPREAHMEGSPSAVKVAAFEDHIEKCSTHLYDLRQIHRKLHFDVSLDALKDDENFKRAWGDFRNDLMNEPEQTLAYVGIAMHHRLLNFLRAMQLRSLKMTSCDKMICFIGTVARLGPSDIICTWMAFKCPECQTPQTVRQPDGVLTYPKSCKGSACTARSGFEPLIGSPFTRTSSIQTILVEESIEDKNRDIFRKPRSIEVTLTNDLVNSVYPGGDVRVTGVLKLRTDDRKSDKPQNCTYYIHAVNVVSTSNPVVKKTTEFTEKSLRAIELIKTDAFPLLPTCPTNRDHRQELHVLIVGDPGLGKSCLLKACCSVAPRAIFTSCSGSSVTGLTATVKAEKEDGSCSIEAGALVLADQGVCCIDEFDKMAVNHASMLEVMEQQSVSVAKAGAICTLPARTVILAAGNPANGHYDRSKTVCENIKLHPAILSRFDISFVILDVQRKDNWLRSQSNDSPTTPLYKRLELRPGEDLDALPHALFEKYIAYAQEKITVRLSKDAGELLKKFYLELRRIQDRSYHIPVTVRQLEGLTRMTLARARLDLCEVAEVHHAQDVIELMRYSMADVLSPDGGLTVDWQRGMHGSGMSKSVLVRKFFAECQDRAFQKGHPEFHMDEFTNIANKLGVKNVLQDILDSLNVQGYILNRGNGFYKIHRKLHFDVSLDALKDDENFKRAWADFRNDLMNEPEQTLAYVGIAMHHRLLNFLRGQEIGCLQTISPRIVGFGPAMQLRSLKMTSCDKMICFIGTVARLGPSDIICTWMAFKCPECQTPQTVRQPDGVLTYPKSCKGSACTARSGFEPLIGSPFTRTSSIQTILVEESIEDKNRDIFRKPRSIEVTLTNDLVNSVYPGGDVRVTGVLKLRTDDRKSDKPQNCTYYIHAVNVVSTSNPVVKKTTEFTEKSLRAIELIKTDAFPLRLLVHSLCPAVRGHEMIKFGFLLGLFSANMSTNRDHRQELHVLIVGDPGLGKSCLLKACCSVAPRAIFTSCSGSSVTGLTATVKAEKEDGSCSIEAGALVLADQGVCCIDEFDKMAVNHASMLEVMEQQSVSVAKAGAICTLPARTVILAAGNPANGHYDRSKTVCENIKLHPAILSRFDISFVILDEQRKDNWLRSQSNDSPTTPLYKRLELRPGEDLDALPHALFEKYIAYAQEKITVRLSKDAGELLKKFYLELRRIQDRSYHIPVTVRQLEGLTRMTLARARLDLCEVAEVHHAQDVIELMRYSMADVLSPDGGLTVDWQRGMHGSGMSKSVLVRKFFAECQDRAFQKGHPEFHMDEFTNIANKLGVKNVLQDILDSLNVQGYILNRGNGFYKVL
uniref:DNA helicase MCM8 n=1 Tax=Lutzomyia longipalpis TaxID=7200 RepID=A0A1B0C8D4_LUTLO